MPESLQILNQPLVKTNIKITVKNLDFFYGQHHILKQIKAEFPANKISAVTGPSGAGKSTFLSVFNRMWESIPGAVVRGSIKILRHGEFIEINHSSISVTALRRAVGMVFQAPNPLPMSIYKNVAFPLKLAGIKDKNIVDERVISAIQSAGLWSEVRDRLKEKAAALSGGQQQRLCMARALVLEPEVLLLDEPTSSLDERSAAKIEELMLQLKNRCTMIMVSHNTEQVKRVADQEIMFGK